MFVFVQHLPSLVRIKERVSGSFSLIHRSSKITNRAFIKRIVL